MQITCVEKKPDVNPLISVGKRQQKEKAIFLIQSKQTVGGSEEDRAAQTYLNESESITLSLPFMPPSLFNALCF